MTMMMPSQRFGTMTLMNRPVDGDYLIPQRTSGFSDKKLVKSIMALIEDDKSPKRIGLDISKTSVRLQDQKIRQLLDQVNITGVRMVGCRRLRMDVFLVKFLRECCPNLTTCVLGMSTYGVETLAPVKALLQRQPKLHHMAFVNMNHKSLLETLWTLDEPVRLESLCLSNSLPTYSFFSDDRTPSEAFDRMMLHLSSLNLSRNPATGPNGLIRLLQNTKALKRLCLANSDQLTAGVISVILQNKGLVYLNLHQMELAMDSAKAITAIVNMVKALPKLETLSLGVILDDDSRPINFLDVCETMQDTFPNITCLRVCVPGQTLTDAVKSRWHAMLVVFPNLKSLVLLDDENAKMKSVDYGDFLSDVCHPKVQLKMPLLSEEDTRNKIVTMKQDGWETDNYFLQLKCSYN